MQLLAFQLLDERFERLHFEGPKMRLEYLGIIDSGDVQGPTYYTPANFHLAIENPPYK